MGRKRLGDAAKSVYLRVRVTEEQKSKIDAAAKRAGQTVSDWSRAVLLAAAESLTKRAK